MSKKEFTRLGRNFDKSATKTGTIRKNGKKEGTFGRKWENWEENEKLAPADGKGWLRPWMVRPLRFNWTKVLVGPPLDPAEVFSNDFTNAISLNEFHYNSAFWRFHFNYENAFTSYSCKTPSVHCAHDLHIQIHSPCMFTECFAFLGHRYINCISFLR